MSVNLLNQQRSTHEDICAYRPPVYTLHEEELLTACDPYDPVEIARLISVIVQNAHSMWSTAVLNRLVSEAQKIAIDNAHRGTSPFNLIDELRKFFAKHGITF